MAQLAIAFAGAAVGGFIGGPMGARIGFMAGALLGGFLFAEDGPNVVVEGPRLEDKTVTSSAFGAPISINYGTVRTSGNIIWSEGIKETRHEETHSTGGGKGASGPTQTNVTYTYSCSFAIAFGEGIADDVLKIWADSKLIYDKTSSSGSLSKNVHFYLHKGTEDQMPDPIISAVEGASSTPAFRGIAYIVFDDLQLEDYGNRLPNITAEITYQQKEARPTQGIQWLSGTPFDQYNTQFAIDEKRQYAYAIRTHTTTDDEGISKINLLTMQEEKYRTVEDMDVNTVAAYPCACDAEGHLIVATDCGNSCERIMVDKDSLTPINRFGAAGSGLDMTPDGFAMGELMVPYSVTALEGVMHYMVFSSVFNKIGILDENMQFVGGGQLLETTGDVQAMCTGTDGVYILALSRYGTPPMRLYKLDIEPGAYYLPLPDSSWQQFGSALEEIGTYTPDQWGFSAEATFNTNPWIVCDGLDGHLIVHMEITDAPGLELVLKLNSSTGAIEWETQDYGFGSVPRPIKPLTYGRFAWANGNDTYSLDTRTGAITTQLDWSELNAATYSKSYYNEREHSLTVTNSGTPSLIKVFLDRGTGESQALSQIVADISERAGLIAAEYDVTELADTDVRGYMITRQMNAREAIQPLATAFFFDGVESDYILKYLDRGRSTSGTIYDDDMIEVESGNVLVETRTQEVELPASLDAVYSDINQDYQVCAQRAQRSIVPDPSMWSNNKVSVQIPVVFDEDEAMQIADKLLYRTWIERFKYQGKLPWRFLAYDPADVVSIDVGDATHSTRLSLTHVGADLTIEFNAISEDASAYTSNKTGSSGLGFSPQEITQRMPTDVWFLDVPLLRDHDDSGGAYSVDYVGLAGTRPDTWPGAFLYQTIDFSLWLEILRAYSNVAHGTVVEALNSPSSPFETDVDSQLTVFMGYGELESCTNLQMLNGANACVLGGEVICFQNATLNADGSYTLDTFLRGQRGTDYACYDHVAGETLIVLSASTLHGIMNPLERLNSESYYKAVTFGTYIEDADVEVHTPDGKDLKPYSPVSVTAENNAGDLEFNWIRRTRLAGAWLNNIDEVPLNEEFERYEIDIYVSGEIARTVTVNDATTYTYLAADQTSDGYDINSGTITIEVFQISAVVGRGFGRLVTLEF